MGNWDWRQADHTKGHYSIQADGDEGPDQVLVQIHAFMAAARLDLGGVEELRGGLVLGSWNAPSTSFPPQPTLSLQKPPCAR